MAFDINNFSLQNTGTSFNRYRYINKANDSIETIMGNGFFVGANSITAFTVPVAGDLVDIVSGAYNVAQPYPDVTMTFVGRNSNDLTAIIPGYVLEPTALTTATSIGLKDNGRTFLLNNAAGFQVTLPFVTLGDFKLTFFVETAPSGGSYTIKPGGGIPPSIIHGNITTSATGAANTTAGTGRNTITFVATAALKGDMIQLYCADSTWYVHGVCSAAGGITLSDT